MTPATAKPPMALLEEAAFVLEGESPPVPVGPGQPSSSSVEVPRATGMVLRMGLVKTVVSLVGGGAPTLVVPSGMLAMPVSVPLWVVGGGGGALVSVVPGAEVVAGALVSEAVPVSVEGGLEPV